MLSVFGTVCAVHLSRALLAQTTLNAPAPALTGRTRAEAPLYREVPWFLGRQTVPVPTWLKDLKGYQLIAVTRARDVYI